MAIYAIWGPSAPTEQQEEEEEEAWGLKKSLHVGIGFRHVFTKPKVEHVQPVCFETTTVLSPLKHK